ncbi:MAG: hypothetical protein KBB11_04680 [Bacteroidales bacterium]|nr:hypothetical protein [Bacteroidales bacterium]
MIGTKKLIKRLCFLAVLIYISIAAKTQDIIIIQNQWTKWETDTLQNYEGKMKVTKKRIKYTSTNCLITEEILFFYDECNILIRKIKIRSDCKRNIGEGRIIRERNYKSSCDKNKNN